MIDYFKLEEPIENQKEWNWYDNLIEGRSYSVSNEFTDPYEAIRIEIYKHENELCCLFLFYYDEMTQYFGVANGSKSNSSLLNEAINNSGIKCTFNSDNIEEFYDILGEYLLDLDPDSRVILTNLCGELRTNE